MRSISPIAAWKESVTDNLFSHFIGVLRVLWSPGLPSYARQQGRCYIVALRTLWFAFDPFFDNNICRCPIIWAYISGLLIDTLQWNRTDGGKCFGSRERFDTSSDWTFRSWIFPFYQRARPSGFTSGVAGRFPGVSYFFLFSFFYQSAKTLVLWSVCT